MGGYNYEKPVFTPEFKLSIVKALASGEKTVVQLCREHNLSDSLSHNWKKLYREKGEAAFTAPTHSRSNSGCGTAEAQEVWALRNKVAELERLIGKPTVDLSILPAGYSFGAKKASQMAQILSVEQWCQMISKLHQLGLKETEGKDYSLRELCRLFKVKRAWYYARQKGKAKQHNAEDQIKTFVEGLLKDYGGYGVRQVTKALQKAGYAIGQHKERHLLKKWGLGWQPLRKRKPQTTVRDPQAVGAENKLAPARKQGLLVQPNRGWVGDVVYVSTTNQSGYLATLLDSYTRKVVGWAVSGLKRYRFNP